MAHTTPAQKSTKTGVVLFKTIASKFAAVTFSVAIFLLPLSI
jgi:hypothetical protein